MIVAPGPVASCLHAFLESAGASVNEPADFSDSNLITRELRRFITAQTQSSKRSIVLTDSPYAALPPSVLASVPRANRPQVWLLLSAEERVDLLPSMSDIYAGYLVKPLRVSSLRRWLASGELPPDSNMPPGRRQTTLAPISERPLRILLVEDNLINAMLTKSLLQRAGHQVRHVTTGASALSEIESLRMNAEQSIDLVLMDVQMPDMDGLEVTRRLRASESRASEPHHLPIIALTANSMQEDRDACIEAGMDGYLIKPFRIADLEITMQKLVRQSQPKSPDIVLSHHGGKTESRLRRSRR